jgi:pyrimidine deaminase RibD-like protein
MTHPFVSTYKKTFADLYKKMCEINPRYIIAIARKGPRLFDLFIGDKVTNTKPIVVSDRAIPYLSFSKEEKIPIFDDIVIFGSTMRDKILELKEVGACPVPFSMTYSLEEAFIKVEYGVGLKKEFVANFCDDIISAFQTIGKPYDLDHPIFVSTSFSRDAFENLTRKYKENFVNVTTPLQSESGIINLTFHTPFKINLKAIFGSDVSKIIPSQLHKVRLMYNMRTQKLYVEPICNCYIEKSTFDISFSPLFDDLNNVLKRAMEVLSLRVRNEIEEKTVYRLIVYLLEYVYGLGVFCFLGVNQNLTLNLTDVYYLYGDQFGEYLIKSLNQVKESFSSKECVENLFIKSKENSGTYTIQNMSLLSELNNQDECQKIDNLLAWINEVISLWNLCRLLRVKDEITRDIKNLYIPGRLNFGFTFEDMLQIVKTKTNEVNPRTLSIIFDYFVDRGILIPLYMRYPNQQFVRAYRFGENLNGLPEVKRAYFSRKALERLIERTKLESISQFEFEKFLSYLIHIFDHLNINKLKELKLGVIIDEFGARPVTEGFRCLPVGEFSLDTFEKRYLVRETIDNKVICDPRTQSDRRLRLNEEFYVIYNKHLNPIESLTPQISLYTDFWCELVYNSEIWHRKDEIMLLLTTCNTKNNFLTAYKEGVYSWFIHDFTRFPKILKEVKILLTLKSKDAAEYSKKIMELDKKLLHQNATRLRQSEEKRKVWEKRTEMINKIDCEVSKKPFLEPIWIDIKSKIFDFTPFSEDEERLFIYLQKLYHVCRASTNLIRATLLERSPGEKDRYVTLYNDAIKAFKNLTGLIELKEIPTEKIEDLIIIETLELNTSILADFFERTFEKKPTSLKDEVGRHALLKAIELAKLCEPETPEKVRPKVGAVIVKNGKIISQGYRNREGRHAEDIAIHNCKREDLEGAILVTTMEPCTVGDCRQGDIRSPCVTYIVESKIKGVIYGILDPNRRIRGEGVRFLRYHGILTESFPADLQIEIEKLNQDYIIISLSQNSF